MKKTTLITLAIASMMSCSNEEVLKSSSKEVITFDNTFVEKATRAIDGSYNTGSLQQFQAYGTITNQAGGTANIFNGQAVNKGGTGVGTNWTYDASNTQYWIPGNTYNFRAVVDGNITNVTTVSQDENGMPTAINLHDASAQKDILYAAVSPIPYTGGQPNPVSFIFDHLMSKAKFTVKNTITTDNGYNYQVSNITIKDTEKNGVYTIGTGWKAAETPSFYDLSFGNAVTIGTDQAAEAISIGYNGSAESNYERLLIPGEKSLTINFDYLLLKDGKTIDTQNKNVYANTLTLEAGKAYNFVIKLGNPGEPITFDVSSVSNWDTDHNDDGTDDEKEI